MIDSLNTMKVVAERVGLSAHVIRVWERRYGAIHPERTDTNRRTYSEEQVERLQLLKTVTDAGRRIGLVAKLSTEELRELERRIKSQSPFIPARVTAGEIIDRCFKAIEKLDSIALERALEDAFKYLGSQGALQQILAPLLEMIGEKWRDGSLTAAHEHFASAIVRQCLGMRSRSFVGAGSGPILVVATPSGQLHELGALLITASAGNLGWNVIYLGASLPATDIAGAALRSGARAVALSLVYPNDDPSLESELVALRRSLPIDIDIVVGGRAMSGYAAALRSINAITSNDLSELGKILDTLRTPSLKALDNVRS
jgi:DNA-binding transcriptional MerR regulator/methylmalonyl-CoA mutase cobalamin-binding subunit